jgi:predicted acylesterase/phospholipase RssA
MAAFNSAGLSAAVVQSIILGLEDGDVRDERFCWKVRVPWIDYFLETEPIREILADLLPEEFNELKKPLSIFVTNEKTAAPEEINCATAHYLNLIKAIIASMSIMGVFPPVLHYSDGGPTANLPLPADWVTYDEVWLLVAKRPLDYHKHTGMLTRLMFNVDVMAEDQIRDTIKFARQHHPNVFVVRPPVKTPEGALHFNHDLIAKAYEFTRDYLSEASCAKRQKQLKIPSSIR